MKEILDGISIASNFEKIFASQYYFAEDGRPTFVDRVITDVSKTQYLFRINKGVEDLSLQVNEHMADEDRAIPFTNMLYIGDGDTDVPSMTVTRKNGGYALAVYKSNQDPEKCKKLYKDGRVDAFFEANYSHNSPLDIFTKVILRKMLAEIRFNSHRHVLKELMDF